MRCSTKSKKDNKYKNNNKKNGNDDIVDDIHMTPEANPIVRAAYDALPTSIDIIPTSILEKENDDEESTPFLSLPLPTPLPMVDDNHDGQNNDDNDAEQQQQKKKNHRHDDEGTNEGRQRRSQEDDIQCYPPIFINTTEELEHLRYNLSQRPPPYHLPKMIAIDSEWYTINIIPADDVVVAPTMNNPPTAKKNAKRNKIKNRSMDIATLQIAYIDENIAQNDDDIDDDVILIRSFVIDLMSDDQVEYQKTAKAFVSWMIGSSCDLLILGFAFVNDLRQLNKYCNNNAATNIAIVKSRCLDVQRLLATSKEIRTGQLPGLKRCSEKYFNKSLRKDDQCSDWTIRPLRPSQLQYAALDAVILLILLSQKKKRRRM